METIGIKVRFAIAALLVFSVLTAGAEARPAPSRPRVMSWKTAYNISLKEVRLSEHETPNADQSGVARCERRTPAWVDCLTWLAGTTAAGSYNGVPLYEHFFCPETYVVRRLPRTFKFYFVGGDNDRHCENYIDESPTVTPVFSGKSLAPATDTAN